ncbi:MAG: J domain-containing protein [Anaerolineae bacterium]|nr:J domain-containing protein [Anaerolineae bacterium]
MARLAYDSTSDHYQVLGIHSSASLDQIRKAFRKLARRYHPDTNPEWEDDARATRRMAQLNEAYAVLRDPASRAEYDRLRWQHIQQRMQQARYYEQSQVDKQARQRADAQKRAGAAKQAHSQTGPQPSGRSQPSGQQQWTGRSRTYTQAGPRWSARPEPDPFTEPPGGWPEVTFRRSPLGLIFFGAILAGIFVLSCLVLISAFSWGGVLVASASFMAGALSLLAAAPYFQGYIELKRDRLIVYSTFGLFPPREVRYDQICGVHEQVFRYKSGAMRFVVIDYFKLDSSGRYDVTHFHSRRLMRVDDHHVLLHALLVRAKARPFPFSKPTWWALVIGNWELFGPLLAVALFLVFAFLSPIWQIGGIVFWIVLAVLMRFT